MNCAALTPSRSASRSSRRQRSSLNRTVVARIGMCGIVRGSGSGIGTGNRTIILVEAGIASGIANDYVVIHELDPPPCRIHQRRDPHRVHHRRAGRSELRPAGRLSRRVPRPGSPRAARPARPELHGPSRHGAARPHLRRVEPSRAGRSPSSPRASGTSPAPPSRHPPLPACPGTLPAPAAASRAPARAGTTRRDRSRGTPAAGPTAAATPSRTCSSATPTRRGRPRPPRRRRPCRSCWRHLAERRAAPLRRAREPSSSSNSRRAAASGSSPSSYSPFGIDHAPSSLLAQYGPPGWTSRTSTAVGPPVAAGSRRSAWASANHGRLPVGEHAPQHLARRRARDRVREAHRRAGRL